MRKLGDQWIEIIDGQEHMLKAVNSTYNCNGCAYLCHDGKCSHESILECPVYRIDAIIKDLGVLNEDGCLPNCWGEYPRVEGVVDSDIKTKRYRCVTRCGIYCATELYRTEQEAIDAWNRRA